MTSKTVRNFSIFRLMAVLATILPLLACNQNVREPINTSANQVDKPLAQRPAQSLAPDTIPLKKRMENALLRQAQRSFSLGYYTTPAHDNAYDKFQSILLINPESEQARAGIQAILLKYAQLTRLAISEGRYTSAKNYLRSAEIYFPANSLLMDLKQKIREAEVSMAGSSESEDVAEENAFEEIVLATVDLNRKSENLQRGLKALALRLENTEEGVLIFARSDREGRWIYKQLKQAVPGYRIRGDIRISKSPKIRILPPF